jgi:hypothetical protein
MNSSRTLRACEPACSSSLSDSTKPVIVQGLPSGPTLVLELSGIDFMLDEANDRRSLALIEHRESIRCRVERCAASVTEGIDEPVSGIVVEPLGEARQHIHSFELPAQIGKEIRGQIKPERLVGEETERRSETVGRRIEELWSQDAPVGLVAKILLEQSGLLAFATAAQAPDGRGRDGCEGSPDLLFEIFQGTCARVLNNAPLLREGRTQRAMFAGCAFALMNLAMSAFSWLADV